MGRYPAQPLEEKLAWMRERMRESAQPKTKDSNTPQDSKFLTVKQVAQELGLGRKTAYNILVGEPGVYRMYTPGSKRPIIRVEREVVDRILRRSLVGSLPPVMHK